MDRAVRGIREKGGWLDPRLGLSVRYGGHRVPLLGKSDEVGCIGFASSLSRKCCGTQSVLRPAVWLGF